MPRNVNPALIHAPSIRQSHGIVHSSRSNRLLIGGQFGILPDGTVATSLEAQFQAAWDNITAILNDAGMSVHNLVRIFVAVTVPGSIHIHRQALEMVLGGQKPVVTFIEVSGLAQPEFLVSIDAEAIAENQDGMFEELPENNIVATIGSYSNS